jgi:surfeit locus 1 family protein
MKPLRSKRRSGVLDATIFTLVGVAILIGLGIWQLDRKAWKEDLIQMTTSRLSASPGNLPPREDWPRLKQASDEFRRVTFSAEFINDKEALVYTAGSALRPDVNGPGYWVFTPARLPGGSIIVVNRGFVPSDRKDAATRPQGALTGSVDIVGVMRWPEARGLFTPADEPNNNLWYLRDHRLMAAEKEWGAVAPFYIDAEAPQAPGGLPSVGKLVLELPNNHLQYALTWFGLALGLAGVYVTWLIGRRRHYY